MCICYDSLIQKHEALTVRNDSYISAKNYLLQLKK